MFILIAIIAESCQNLFSFARHKAFQIVHILHCVMFALWNVAVNNSDFSGNSSGSPESASNFIFVRLVYAKLQFQNSLSF